MIVSARVYSSSIQTSIGITMTPSLYKSFGSFWEVLVESVSVLLQQNDIISRSHCNISVKVQQRITLFLYFHHQVAGLVNQMEAIHTQKYNHLMSYYIISTHIPVHVLYQPYLWQVHWPPQSYNKHQNIELSTSLNEIKVITLRSNNVSGDWILILPFMQLLRNITIYFVSLLFQYL